MKRTPCERSCASQAGLPLLAGSRPRTERADPSPGGDHSWARGWGLGMFHRRDQCAPILAPPPWARHEVLRRLPDRGGSVANPERNEIAMEAPAPAGGAPRPGREGARIRILDAARP